MTNPPQSCNPFIGADALSPSSLQFLQQMQAFGLQQQLLQGKSVFNVLNLASNDKLFSLIFLVVSNSNLMNGMNGLNGAQLDSSPNSMSTGSTATHPSLLQPISMQNILAMACLGQSPLSPNASSQSLSAAQLGSASTPLCTFNDRNQYKCVDRIEPNDIFYRILGSVHDYNAAALPQYASGLYAPTLTTGSTLNTTASLVAGKQIEGMPIKQIIR